MYEVRGAMYEVRGAMYEVRGAMYEVRGTRRDVGRSLKTCCWGARQYNELLTSFPTFLLPIFLHS